MAQRSDVKTQTTDNRAAPERTGALQDELIIDCDVHTSRGFSKEELAEHIEPRWKNRVLHGSHGITPSSNWDRDMGSKVHRQQTGDPDAFNKELCQGFGVDYPILNTVNYLNDLPQRDFAAALMPALNDHLIDKFLDGYDHFNGLITVGCHRPDKSAEEIDRLADEKQMVGVYTTSGGVMPYPHGDEQYDIIYQAAEDNNLPIVFHGRTDVFGSMFPIQNAGFDVFFPVHVLAHVWCQMLTVTNLITNGTPEKFPDLNFVFVESGISWVPQIMYRLNREYSMRRSEVPLLTKSPQKYIQDQFYFATQPIGEPDNPVDIKLMIEAIGADSLVFSTDYPHWDFDNPETVANMLNSLFTPEEKDKVLYKNANEIFNLGL